jgi:hypothetical protein
MVVLKVSKTSVHIASAQDMLAGVLCLYLLLLLCACVACLLLPFASCCC